MDNEEIQGVKFSEFPSVTPESSDEVVGLHSGGNARFSLVNIILLIRQGLANIFVPNTRKVNNHALSSDITLTASDVGARSSSWTPSASDVGAVPTTAVGSADGVASLGNDGKVPAAQLPPISAEGKADEDTIAPIEATTTATSAHPLGSIFYLNGDLYRALADIAEGGTINTGSGGNATQTTVAANFSRIVKLTAAQYASLSAAEKAADIIYIVTDDELDADDVCYDNATSGLTATDVQEALDELAAGAGGSTAATTSYDNTTSGLAATNAQDALDELAEEKADQATVAPVEASTTATSAHPLGSIFYLGRVLYRALADIAIGDTINTASGGNATQTTIARSFVRAEKVTSAEYAALSAAEKAADIVYIVTDQPVDYVTPDMIAWPETGTTASRAYAVGKYFCKDGVLYRVKTAIQSGESFATGTNCESVPGGGLNDLRSDISSIQAKSQYVYSGENASVSISVPDWNSSVFSFMAFGRWAGHYYATYSIVIDADGYCGLLAIANTVSTVGISSASFNTSTKILTLNLTSAYCGITINRM